MDLPLSVFFVTMKIWQSFGWLIAFGWLNKLVKLCNGISCRQLKIRFGEFKEQLVNIILKNNVRYSICIEIFIYSKHAFILILF